MISTSTLVFFIALSTTFISVDMSSGPGAGIRGRCQDIGWREPCYYNTPLEPYTYRWREKPAPPSVPESK